MKNPLANPSVRRLMLLVAATALLLGVVVERRSRFLRLAGCHAAWAGKLVFHDRVGRYQPASYRDPEGNPVRLADRRWHDVLAGKYRWAARYPFLPVRPDLPRPPASLIRPSEILRDGQ